MSIVVEGLLGEKDYSFPDDFVPPFLSVKSEVLTPLESPVEESDSPEEVEVSQEASGDTVEASVVAQPLGPVMATAGAPGKAAPALIRGLYTVLFSLLGMAGAAFAYLKDNLGSITDLDWQTIAIIVGGALLAGLGYGLKKYYKPDGKF